MPHQTTIIQKIKTGWMKYWFVAVPAIVINVVFLLDQVIGEHRTKSFTVVLKAETFAELATQDEEDNESQAETLRAHWVTTNDEGNLEGRISAIEAEESSAVPIERLKVTLLQKGETIRKGTTIEEGRFVLKDVDPGVYTLVASGKNGFLAYGVHVLPKLAEFDALDDARTKPLSPRNRFSNTNNLLGKSTKSMLAKRNFYVSVNRSSQVNLDDELQIDAAAIPPDFNTLKAISENYMPAAIAAGTDKTSDDLKAIKKATDIRDDFQFTLTDDGSFSGRIQPIATEAGNPAKLSEMNIFLIQDDIEVARVSVEENGKFEIESVEPGVYSIVAAGKDGFAALSLELIEPQDDEDLGLLSPNRTSQYVSTGAVETETGKTKKKVPFFIAIVTDPDDLKFIQTEVKRVGAARAGLVADAGAARVVPTLPSDPFTPPVFQEQIVGLPVFDPFATQPITYAPIGGGGTGFTAGPVNVSNSPISGPTISPRQRVFSSGPINRRELGRLSAAGILLALSIDDLSDSDDQFSTPAIPDVSDEVPLDSPTIPDAPEVPDTPVDPPAVPETPADAPVTPDVPVDSPTVPDDDDQADPPEMPDDDDDDPPQDGDDDDEIDIDCIFRGDDAPPKEDAPDTDRFDPLPGSNSDT